jgi:hypothetical protein
MSNTLGRLNARERRLLAITATLMAAGAVLLLGRTAFAAVRDLNDRIADRELEIENLSQQNAQADAVNSAYSQVVQEHSSELTMAEIHDALRREIFQLAQVEMPAKGDQPAKTVPLVRIPTLLEGTLTQGVGHREYQIRFQVPVARLEYLLVFLERIEESDQLLRIDTIEIGRPPQVTNVSAMLQITRTVLDNPEAVRDEGAGQ